MIDLFIYRPMQLFCAFSSTSAWVVIAFVVGNEQEKKTFAGVLYDEQKNNVARRTKKHTVARNTFYILKILLLCKEVKTRPHQIGKERVVMNDECGNKF